jgi:hypothetical protein
MTNPPGIGYTESEMESRSRGNAVHVSVQRGGSEEGYGMLKRRKHWGAKNTNCTGLGFALGFIIGAAIATATGNAVYMAIALALATAIGLGIDFLGWLIAPEH